MHPIGHELKTSPATKHLQGEEVPVELELIGFVFIIIIFIYLFLSFP